MASLSQSMASFIQRLDTARMPPEVMEKARVCLLNACGTEEGGAVALLAVHRQRRRARDRRVGRVVRVQPHVERNPAGVVDPAKACSNSPPASYPATSAGTSRSIG
jgi:hypothetical protein